MFEAIKRSLSGEQEYDQRGTEKFASTQAALADYEIGDKLGEGGFGIVSQVHEKSAKEGIDVAVKVIPLSMVIGDNPDGMDYVYKRLERLRDFNVNPHPHVIRLLDCPQDFPFDISSSSEMLRSVRVTKEDLFVFIELCRGLDLFDRCQKTKLSEDDAKKAMRNLCSAVAHMHENRLVHRDIKMENIVFRREDSPIEDVVLADFSCMIEAGPYDKIKGLAGTYGYQSPEMSSEWPYSMNTDEWSLGVIAYEMLTARTPFKSMGGKPLQRETAKGKVSYPKRYWKDLSPEAKDFTKRLLCRDPAQRMLAGQALSHPWLAGSSKNDASDTELVIEEGKFDAQDDDENETEEQRPVTRSESAENSRPLYDRPTPLSETDANATGAMTYDLTHVMLGKIPGSQMLRLQQLDEYGMQCQVRKVLHQEE